MMRLVECTVLNGRDGNNNLSESEEVRNALDVVKLELIVAKTERYKAEAARLRAEGRMFEDIGSHYKELACKAEAEAFIAQADRTTHEKLQEMVRDLKVKTRKNEKNEKGEEVEVEVETDELLLVAKARSEIERDIARNKDLATKPFNRSNNNRNYNGRNNGSPRRGGQIVDPGKEGAGALGGSSARRGIDSVRSAEALAAMRAETKT
jgi:hypothetical protein